ncbi:MAG: HD-GYP domain-containing protein [Dehalococcoidia bacterium]
MSGRLQNAKILVVGDETSAIQDQLSDGGYQFVQFNTHATLIGLFTEKDPDLVILDVRENSECGLKSLERLNSRFSDQRRVPVIVVEPANVFGFAGRALRLGAVDVLARATGPDELLLRVRNALRVHFEFLDLENRRREDAKRLRSEFVSLEQDAVSRFQLLLTMRGLATYHEMNRIALLSERLVLELGGPEWSAHRYAAAAPLRDIGQLVARAMDDPLRDHVQAGQALLRNSEVPALRLAAEIAGSHHERWDGTGCLGLRGEQIPLAGRIVSVVETYVESTNGSLRSSRRLSRDAALNYLDGMAGTWFEERLVEAFHNVADDPLLPLAPSMRPALMAA